MLHCSLERVLRASVIAIVLLHFSKPTSAQTPQPYSKVGASTDSVPVLVELFTSEGCSSCPPADVILQKLDQYQPVAGAQLIVLSEHVTYWDHDGWKDPNSSQVFTERQSSYESEVGEKEPYTPQFIVDGTQSVSLDKVQQLENAINKARSDRKLSIRIVEANVDSGDSTLVRARIETEINFEKHNADVFLAIALNNVESQVLRGENGGKHLQHVAVVEQLIHVGKLPKGKSFVQDCQLKLKPGEDLKNIRLIAFAQETGPGKVLGSTIHKTQ